MINIFAQRLRTRRQALGLSRVQLAKGIGQHESSIARYESDSGDPTLTTLCKLAACLGVTVDWLAGTDHLGTQPPKTKPIMAKSLTVAKEDLPDAINADFCIIMNDDSMTGCGIKKNDRVCFYYADQASSGEIILVNHLKKGYLLRRVFFENKKIILKAENQDYEDIVIDQDESENYLDVALIGIRVEDK